MGHRPLLRVHSAITTLLVASSASAQNLELGNGRDGALVVTERETVINASTPLLNDAGAGDTFISVVDSTGLQPQDVVLLVQSQVRSDGERRRVGEFSLHVVDRVVGTRVNLASPLSRTWRAGETQVVRVPQYTNVAVASGASLVARPWDGSSGGVLALMATGVVRNEGELSAAGKGLRGGVPRDVSDTERNCSADDEPAPRGAMRGEGILVGTYESTSTGRANADTGGGGGVCQYSGGGGGGSLGEGGTGGASADGRRPVGGRGGAQLASTGLVFGGAGGAANGSSGAGGAGGRGGGALFLRARSLEGQGTLSVNGSGGQTVDSMLGAAGGGGGAGGVVLELLETASCQVFAVGGAGGRTVASGPGGGGGGGRVSLRAATVLGCPASVAGGAAGEARSVDGFGATAGLPGSVAIREVPAREPFGAGPGVTLQPFGCACSTAAAGWWWLGLGLVARVSRRRRRAPLI